MEKRKVREEIIQKRDTLSLEIKKSYDEKIFKNLIISDIYKKSKKIFIYISFGSEVDTKRFIKYALNDNKEIYVPKTNKDTKEMIAINIHSLDNMYVDKWGILEPKIVDKNKISESFDLIIMPGVAFDRSGNRIGYGGGYYDKYISKLNLQCTKLVLAYDLQIVNEFKSEQHDIKVDYIITNNEFIKIKKIKKNYWKNIPYVYNKDNKLNKESFIKNGGGTGPEKPSNLLIVSSYSQYKNLNSFCILEIR